MDNEKWMRRFDTSWDEIIAEYWEANGGWEIFDVDDGDACDPQPVCIECGGSGVYIGFTAVLPCEECSTEDP